MRFLILTRKTLLLTLVTGILFTSGSLWLVIKMSGSPVLSTSSETKVREIHMVTGEFKSKTETGKEIEAYRWDPGTIFMEKDELVHLIIYGVNGKEHPFMIEGTDITGSVKKGEETVVPLKFNKEGTYRLVCLTHPNKEQNGPMIAYIVVD